MDGGVVRLTPWLCVEAMGRMRRLLGLLLFIASWILFAAAFAVPWFGLTPGVVAAIVAMLLILAEISFWVSIVILGKPAIDRFMQWWS